MYPPHHNPSRINDPRIAGEIDGVQPGEHIAGRGNQRVLTGQAKPAAVPAKRLAAAMTTAAIPPGVEFDGG